MFDLFCEHTRFCDINMRNLTVTGLPTNLNDEAIAFGLQYGLAGSGEMLAGVGHSAGSLRSLSSLLTPSTHSPGGLPRSQQWVSSSTRIHSSVRIACLRHVLRCFAAASITVFCVFLILLTPPCYSFPLLLPPPRPSVSPPHHPAARA